MAARLVLTIAAAYCNVPGAIPTEFSQPHNLAFTVNPGLHPH